MKEVIILVIVVVLFLGGMFAVAISQSQYNESHPDIPDREVCFVFPDGYELVAVTQSGLSQTVLPAKYYCLNHETNQYLQCVPVEVDCK